MKLILAEPKYLKESISIISDLVTEARFKINTDGIELLAMDPANVALVIFKMLSSSFVEFKVSKQTDIAINLSSLKQVLSRSKPSDMIMLEVEENKLKIQLKGITVRTFYLPIIDVEEKDQKVPDLKFSSTINFSAQMLQDAIEDADIVAESVTFVAEKGKLLVQAEGDLSKAKIEMKEDSETEIRVEEESPIKSKYSIEYLKKMIKGSKLSEKASIQFSKNYPMKLEFSVVNKMSLKFILAPRVEND